MKNFDEFLNESVTALTQEQIDFLNGCAKGKWKLNNGLVDIKGSIEIKDKTINEFPVNFGTVTDEFDCGNCIELTSLKGSPRKVRYFSCFNTSVTSLKGGPDDVEIYNANGCKLLVSLKGAPETVKEFSCHGCDSLTTLEEGPKNVDNFSCNGSNKIKNLKGMPHTIKIFSCNGCTGLVSLEGAPESINYFNCSFCDSLESLKYCPRIIYGMFNCGSCPLISLEYGPEEVYGDYHCSECNITTLKGVANIIQGVLDVRWCNLDTLEHKAIKLLTKILFSDNDRLPKCVNELTSSDIQKWWSINSNLPIELVKMWIKSKIKIDKFKKEYYGAIALSEFNI